MNDQDIRGLVASLFLKYDWDKSNTLEPNEITGFFNDIFKLTGDHNPVAYQEITSALKFNKGPPGKEELYNAVYLIKMKRKAMNSQANSGLQRQYNAHQPVGPYQATQGGYQPANMPYQAQTVTQGTNFQQGVGYQQGYNPQMQGQPNMAKQPMQQSMHQSIPQPMGQSISQPMPQPMQQAIQQTMQQPMPQSMQQPILQSMQQPMQQSFNQPDYSRMQQPYDQPMQAMQSPVPQLSNQTMARQIFQPQKNQVMGASLSNYIDRLYIKHDRDRSNSLDVNELAAMINDIMVDLKLNITFSTEQARQILSRIDYNKGGRVQKQEFQKFIIDVTNGKFSIK